MAIGQCKRIERASFAPTSAQGAKNPENHQHPVNLLRTRSWAWLVYQEHVVNYCLYHVLQLRTKFEASGSTHLGRICRMSGSRTSTMGVF
jgi:hypothetical protein